VSSAGQVADHSGRVSHAPSFTDIPQPLGRPPFTATRPDEPPVVIKMASSLPRSGLQNLLRLEVTCPMNTVGVVEDECDVVDVIFVSVNGALEDTLCVRAKCCVPHLGVASERQVVTISVFEKVDRTYTGDRKRRRVVDVHDEVTGGQRPLTVPRHLKLIRVPPAGDQARLLLSLCSAVIANDVQRDRQCANCADGRERV